MRKFNLLLVLILAVHLNGQDRMLTMDEAITGSTTTLRTKNLTQLQWIADTDSFSYIDSLDGRFGLIIHEAGSADKKLVLSLDSLNTLFKKSGIETGSHWPVFNWINQNTFRFNSGQKYYNLTLDGTLPQLAAEIPETAAGIDFCDDQSRAAYTIDHNLHIAFSPEMHVAVSSDGMDGLVYGQSVHRNEFGIFKGTFWSPKSNFLAFYRKDERMVSGYPLVDISQRPATTKMIRYPMAGMTSEQVQVGVYNLASGSVTYLQTGQPGDQYLTNITWSPDEKEIYVALLNRDQNHLRLVSYDPQTGQPLRTLFEEHDTKYVEPDHGPIFLPATPDRFLWFSKRAGFDQLYLYDRSGRLLKSFNSLPQDISGLVQIDAQGKNVLLTMASVDGLEIHGWLLDLNSGKFNRLTEQAGVHNLRASKNLNWFIDEYSDIRTPRIILLKDKKGRTTDELLRAPDPLRGYAIGKLELLKITGPEGITHNARLFYPKDFDPAKKYPVIVYVYGGPHGQMVQNRWTGGWSWWFWLMAQRGYLVFTMDNRGTNNRGIKYEQAIFRQLGSAEIEDQQAGVDYLKSLAFVDSSRIGVHGWSYGGFMTISLMSRKPGLFKAGVAGGPVTDWQYYEVMYGERYMDTPMANPDGYETANVLNYVKQLRGKLLLIHDNMDNTVVWQHSLNYLEKAMKSGVQVDYAVYPGHEHNVRGKDRIHLYQKITDYFELHLK